MSESDEKRGHEEADVDKVVVVVATVLYFFIALWFGWSTSVWKCDVWGGGTLHRRQKRKLLGAGGRRERKEKRDDFCG